MGLKQRLWKWSDRIEIWCTQTFNYNPRQRALELKQDLLHNKKIDDAINEALGVNNDQKKTTS